jgi:hypothetical protein
MSNEFLNSIARDLKEFFKEIGGIISKAATFIKNVFKPTNESLADEFAGLYNWLHPWMVLIMIVVSIVAASNFGSWVQVINPKLDFPEWLLALVLFIIQRVSYTLVIGLLATFISLNSKLSKVADAMTSKDEK